jgi:Ca2+-binding EF-hand superfamily protein
MKSTRCAVILLGLIGGVAQAATPPPVAPPSYPRLFISPMGEPFRGKGDEDQIVRWFRQADSDRDGKLLRAEFAADAERFFKLLDQNGDGEIAGAEIDRYEYELAPEISGLRFQGPGADAPPRDRPTGKRPDKKTRQAMARLAALQGASRYGILDIPEPVTAADVEMNGRVTRQEFLAAADQRFTMLDTDKDGKLAFAELPEIGGQRPEVKRQR